MEKNHLVKKPLNDELKTDGENVILGIITILYVMFTWWRDIIREALFEGQHTIAVQQGLRMGIILFIVSEVCVPYKHEDGSSILSGTSFYIVYRVILFINKRPVIVLLEPFKNVMLVQAAKLLGAGLATPRTLVIILSFFTTLPNTP